MAIAPAATSASPAVMIRAVESTAPDSPAARAKGTVKPSDMPMTMSRTVSEAVKCFSMCGVCGIRHHLREGRLPEGEGCGSAKGDVASDGHEALAFLAGQWLVATRSLTASSASLRDKQIGHIWSR